MKYKCSCCNGLFDKDQMTTDNSRPNGVKGYCKKCNVRIAWKSQRRKKEKDEARKRKDIKPKKHTRMPYLYKGQMRHPPHDESPRNMVRIVYHQKRKPVVRNIKKFIGRILL